MPGHVREYVCKPNRTWSLALCAVPALVACRGGTARTSASDSDPGSTSITADADSGPPANTNAPITGAPMTTTGTAGELDPGVVRDAGADTGPGQACKGECTLVGDGDPGSGELHDDGNRLDDEPGRIGCSRPSARGGRR